MARILSSPSTYIVLCVYSILLQSSTQSNILKPLKGLIPFVSHLSCPYRLEIEADCPNSDKSFKLAKNQKTHFQPLAEQRKGDQCATTKTCDFDSKYRTVDGSCNNIEHSTWGQAFTSFTRLLPAVYQDGIKEPRLMSNGKPLPSARVLRTTFFPVNECPSDVNSVMLMYWGQLIAHDTTHLGALSEPDGSTPVCCPGQSVKGTQVKGHGHSPKVIENNRSNICFSIKVPADDKFYSKYGVTCLPLSRAVTTDQQGCPLKPVQQIIDVTHFIDASQVYGSKKKLADSLRTFTGGKLKYQESAGQIFLPNIAKPTERCNVASESATCYESGDDRVDQNPGIAMLTTLFMREHNRLCDELAKINPTWVDETLYQEARRIVFAELEHITYSDFISVLLGEKYSTQQGLKVKNGFEGTYDPRIDPNTINEVASGAYRLFHNMIPLDLLSSTQKGCPLKLFNLADFWENPGIIQGNEFSNFVYGMEFLPSKADNDFFSDSVANLFNKKNNTGYGTDLPAIDIQRGRDCGLPPYVSFKKACGYKEAKDFDDLGDMISKENIKKLKSLYNKVGDIDLMVGGILEYNVQDSTVGATFQCLLKEQFYRWRYGDRYFYNLKGQSGSFTEDQLKEIQKVTLAGLFCNNVAGTTEVVLDIFRLTSKKNKVVPCSKVPAIDLKFWAKK